VRDYFYVEDGAAAYMHLAEQLAARPELRGQAFNFSNEIQLTVLELVNRILRVMGSHSVRTYVPRPVTKIRHQYLSAAKARELLGWEPLFTLEKDWTGRSNGTGTT